MRTYFTLFAGGLMVAAVPAQMTISDANMRVRTPAPSGTTQMPAAFDLRSDALQIDQGFEHWWYYRVDTDSQEFALSTVGGLVPTVRASEKHADHDYPDLDARGLLKATQDFDVYSSGAASGVFSSRLTLTNTSSAPLTVNVFAYADVEVAGTGGNDVCTATTTSHYVTDGTGIQIEVRGIGADLSDVGAFPTVRNMLTDPNANTLTNNHAPFAGDYTGAFQWQDRVLRPFEAITCTLIFAVDTTANIVPLIENYGAANGSQFAIEGMELPLQDNAQPVPFRVRIKNALPNAVHRMVVGLAPWPANSFITGIDLWVDPFSLIGVFGGFTSATGTAELFYVVPPSPYLAGFSAYFQGFYVDGNAPNGFAYESTGLRMRIGKL